MDFFSAQDAARAKTKTLIVYFVLAVLCIITAIYAVAVVSLSFLDSNAGSSGQYPIQWWQPQTLLLVAVGIVLMVGIASMSKIAALRSGGGAVAKSLGGRRIEPNTRDPDERRLMNVVEEMAIASGCPVPEVYLLDGEEAINGFAAGFTPGDAAIAVTRGCLKKLSRDELQGVVAHEFSHIMNGDMRMNIRLMGVLFGILVLAVAGRICMQVLYFAPRRRGGKDNSAAIFFAIFLIGLSVFIIGYIGVFFGRLIQAAVSRQREFLADAAAVQYTRNPEGIAGALRKIGGLAGSRITNPHGEEAAHFFFASSRRFDLAGMLATHPPLEKRISLIEAGRVPPPPVKTRREPEEKKTAASAVQGRSRIGPRELIAGIGIVGAAQLDYARSLHQGLDADLQEKIHDPQGAQAVLLGLLLDADPGERAAQLRYLETEMGTSVRPVMDDLFVRLRRLPVTSKLPLVEIAVPALSMMDEAAFNDFERRLQALAEMDKSISLFEFALLQVVRRQLRRKFNPGHSGASNRNAQSLAPAFFLVLSALVHVEERSEEGNTQTFQAAVKEAPHFLGRGRLLPEDAIEFKNLEGALDQLAGATGELKKEMLSALAHAVVHNGEIGDNELEILRTVALCLDCPLPPLK